MRKKMYKVGKLWTVAAIAMGGLVLTNQVANADQTANSQVTVSQPTSSYDNSVTSQSNSITPKIDDSQKSSSSTSESTTNDVAKISENSTSQASQSDSKQATSEANKDSQNSTSTSTNVPSEADRQAALKTFADQKASGYLYAPAISSDNGGYAWFENGTLFTGFRYYAGTYYWFQDGIRQNDSWHQAWHLNYYTGNDGRAVQGMQTIDGKRYYFGDDGTYYLRTNQEMNIDGQRYHSNNQGIINPWQGYISDPTVANGGYRWYEDGQLFTGFRYYTGAYYWFNNGARQDNSWHQAWGMNYYTGNDGRAVQGMQSIDRHRYYFGDDSTYYLRTNQEMNINGQQYRSNAQGVLQPWQGYISDPMIADGGYRWYEDGQLFTGFRYYTGTYYWFNEGARQDNTWHEAWNMKYYTGADGRAVQGVQNIGGTNYYFGDNGTYFLRTNGYYVSGNGIYFANKDGQLLTGNQNIFGNNLYFDGNGRLDMNSVHINFPYQAYNQNAEGAPEGCEGTSFQMALSAKGKAVPSLSDIYNRIGYGFNVSADNGFHGNPFGYGQWYTQTVFAAPLAKALNNAYGVQTRDITGASPEEVIVQLLQWNPVITYIPWDLQITGGNNYHVQLITGYENGSFKIADPIPINHGSSYWLPASTWYYLNQNIQPVGFSSPRGMNVAVI
ncbi:C39 family peptidase [Convivina intestini]|uniref:C39 family peptidase n=1 Tax=Convivina intestini TaxID=1505726 RepID=UPI002010362D|nr:C39 family peptidase [Convivina intestini]CAH1850310.1 hypothetical protein R078131_00064 [Convivina intestini]